MFHAAYIRFRYERKTARLYTASSPHKGVGAYLHSLVCLRPGRRELLARTKTSLLKIHHKTRDVLSQKHNPTSVKGYVHHEKDNSAVVSLIIKVRYDDVE